MSQPTATVVRVPLPDTAEHGPGQWVDVRSPKRVTRGDRRRLVAAGKTQVLADGTVVNAMDSGMATLDGLVTLWVVAWSLTRVDAAGATVPWPIPADAPELLDELDLDISNAIEDVLAPVMEKLAGKAQNPADPDPQSPTVPSAA